MTTTRLTVIDAVASELVDRFARFNGGGLTWDGCSRDIKDVFREDARAAMHAVADQITETWTEFADEDLIEAAGKIAAWLHDMTGERP